MPEVGDVAPDFELKSHLTKDKKVRLSDWLTRNFDDARHSKSAAVKLFHFVS